MKKINFKQFIALCDKADKIVVDGNIVLFNGLTDDDTTMTFRWSYNNEDDDSEVNVYDFHELYWDSSRGQVSFIDGESLPCKIEFFIEFPLQDLPKVQ